jgi:LytS/YehU family sensor histidine kinase
VRHALVLLAGTLVVSIARSLLDPPLALLLGAPSPPWLRATRVLGAFGSFLAVVVMLHAVLFYREMQAREREATRLAQSLAQSQLATTQARLDALRAQLQPHFLFNALNAVAALLHHDPMAADRMLTRLADLLRSVLQAPATDEHPLRAELAMLDQYLDVMSIRFGPRLVVERSVDPVLLECAVPSLVLQPLAENALEHGLWPRAGVGTLRITARSAGERLILMIEDDGVGEAADLPRELSFGIGLENTRRRLEHLYGDNATLALAPRPDGGTRVTIEMPRRVLTTDEASHA